MVSNVSDVAAPAEAERGPSDHRRGTCTLGVGHRSCVLEAAALRAYKGAAKLGPTVFPFSLPTTSLRAFSPFLIQ